MYYGFRLIARPTKLKKTVLMNLTSSPSRKKLGVF